MYQPRLRAKFLLPVLSTLAIIFGILLLIIMQREARLLSTKAEEKERLLARAVLGDLRAGMLSGRPGVTPGLTERLREEYGLARLRVVRADGSPAFDDRGGRVTLPQIEQVFRSGSESHFNEPPSDETGADPLHTILFPLDNNDECRRCHAGAGPVLGVIVVSHSTQDTQGEIAGGARRLSALFAGVMLLVGGALYAAVNRIVLGPLGTLRRGATALGKGDLDYRIDLPAPDEFGDVAGAFNEMARRLKETYGGLESMVKVRSAELQESVRLMRGILSSMSSGVVLLDLEGKVKLINRQGASILRCVQEDMMGRKLADVVPETAAFMDAQAGDYKEISVRVPDGAPVPVGFTSSVYPDGGAQEGVITVFRDLAELKALQAELLNKERFAAMGRVVAGVAHEIRNPLFSISAIGQIFERDLTDAAHKELSRALLSETRRLNQLVEELLIYGRPIRLKLSECDVRALWREIAELHAEELRRRGIRLVEDFAARYPPTPVDAYQVRQVFLNLLRNAMEATPDGGVITASQLLADRFVVFSLSDNGAGIPAEQQERVFDLFFTTKPKGTGLGLAICKKIVQDHGGDISLQSVEGKGTTVVIRLPYTSEGR